MTSLPVATPHHRAIVLVDIEGSTGRTNNGRAWLRVSMYDLVKQALRASKVAERHRDPFIDRGDGVLVLFHPVKQVPKTVLLNTFVPTLTKLIAEHNERSPEQQFRLRVAVHAGEVHYDAQGVFGEAVDATFRLLQAAEVKRKLADADAPLVLVVSDDIYQSLIRHGYDGIDHRDYENVVRVRVGMRQYDGWVRVLTPLDDQDDDQRRP
jgi:class 3 adenylate cyclase